MGIIDTDVANAVANAKGQSVLTNLRNAKRVEFLTDGLGIWINVDGVCVLRIDRVDEIFVDTSSWPEGTGKVFRL